MLELVGGIQVDMVEHVQVSFLNQDIEVHGLSDESLVDGDLGVPTSHLDSPEDLSVIGIDDQDEVREP